MDAAQKAKYLKRPERWEEIGDHKFLIQLPTKSFVADLFMDRGSALRGSAYMSACRRLCDRWIKGWQGVTGKDLGDLETLTDEEKAQTIEFDRDLLSLFLDENPDKVSELGAAFFDWHNARRKKAEDAEKN